MESITYLSLCLRFEGILMCGYCVSILRVSNVVVDIVQVDDEVGGESSMIWGKIDQGKSMEHLLCLGMSLQRLLPALVSRKKVVRVSLWDMACKVVGV